jgi:hypothetical protein
MDICLSLVGLLVILAIAWWLAKTVLKLAGCVFYAVILGIVTIGIAIILVLFVF